jgi:hypothetical protein
MTGRQRLYVISSGDITITFPWLAAISSLLGWPLSMVFAVASIPAFVAAFALVIKGGLGAPIATAPPVPAHDLFHQSASQGLKPNATKGASGEYSRRR